LLFNSVHSAHSSVAAGASSSSAALLVPNLDWGHVLHHLSLLDAGALEKTLLTSAQGDTMLLTSYAQVRDALTQAWDELQARQNDEPAAVAAATHAHGGGEQQQLQQHQQHSFTRRSVLMPHK
jgi:hypothetical protein